MRSLSYATDALQFHGLATRAGHMPPGLSQGPPGSRLQHEHSMVAIQDAAVKLEPGAVSQGGFFAWFEEHHPAASSTADILFADRALSLPEAQPASEQDEAAYDSPSASLFATAPLLDALELTSQDTTRLFGNELHDEEHENGKLCSFFTGPHKHVVLKAKELKELPPHGHIIRTGSSLTPDEEEICEFQVRTCRVVSGWESLSFSLRSFGIVVWFLLQDPVGTELLLTGFKILW